MAQEHDRSPSDHPRYRRSLGRRRGSCVEVKPSYEEKTTDTWILPLIRGVSRETVSRWRRTRKSTREEPSRRSRRVTSSRKGGSCGLHNRISPLNGSNCSPREASSSVNGVALAQACGAQATG